MSQPSDNHRHPGLTVRPPRAIQDAAKQVLAEHGWTMQDFMTACLAAVGAEPEATLERIAKHRVPPNRRGRPVRTEAVGSPAGGASDTPPDHASASDMKD